MYLIFRTVPTTSMLTKMIAKRLSIMITTATIQCHWSLAAAKLEKDNSLRIENNHINY